MQIIFHTGAHFTDDDRLLKCLLRNKDDFAARGVSVPGPSKYRTLLKSTLNALKDAPPGPEARDVLLDAILDDAQVDRMILSNSNFFGAPRAALRQGQIYPMAPERVAHLRQLFAYDQVEVFMGLRNPATFLPSVFSKSPPEQLDGFMASTDPVDVRWSNTIAAIRQMAPDVPLTIWCNEDTPLIWAQLIREMAGLEHGEKIVGGFDLLSEIMAPAGMRRFRAYLKQHPVMTEVQKRRVISAFLDKFALEDQLEEELDLPGWDEPLVDELSDLYDEDIRLIRRMPGVSFVEP